MNVKIIPDEEGLSKCAWCHKYISDDVEVFGSGATLTQDIDLSEYEGFCIQINLVSEEKPIYMMVTAEGSDAKNDGNDAMFLFCSEECGQKLKTVLDKEISLGMMLGENPDD